VQALNETGQDGNNQTDAEDVENEGDEDERQSGLAHGL
jgi:hypothetical protein